MKLSSKMDEKMTRDILVDPPPPVSFVDTIASHPPPPFPSVSYYLNVPLWYNVGNVSKNAFAMKWQNVKICSNEENIFVGLDSGLRI